MDSVDDPAGERNRADAVIRILADAEAEARAQLTVYRELAQAAIHALAEETCRHDLTRDELTRERDEARRLRSFLVTKAA